MPYDHYLLPIPSVDSRVCIEAKLAKRYELPCVVGDWGLNGSEELKRMLETVSSEIPKLLLTLGLAYLRLERRANRSARSFRKGVELEGLTDEAAREPVRLCRENPRALSQINGRSVGLLTSQRPRYSYLLWHIVPRGRTMAA